MVYLKEGISIQTEDLRKWCHRSILNDLLVVGALLAPHFGV